jgi:dolichyl-phosphate-mannose-protein mannosyltransferase
VRRGARLGSGDVSSLTRDAPAAGSTLGLSRTATGTVVPSAGRRVLLGRPADDPVLGWAATIAVTLLAGFLRLWHLGYPKAFLFDETYYAKDAWSMLHLGYASNWPDKANQQILHGHTLGLWTRTPEMVVHPPVGDWLIALGEHTFGMTPFGWRVASAVAGTLMVMVMIRLARRVTGSLVLGLTAGLLMTFDGLQLVLSRLALLDIFLAFFTLCAVSCLVADRDWFRARLAARVDSATGGSWGPLIWWRPWRLAAGVFWGLSLGSKWSGIYLLAAIGLLVWFWDAGARRSFGVRLSLLKSAALDALPSAGYLLLLPALIYAASWTAWLLHSGVYEQSLSDTQYGPYWGGYLKHPAHGFLEHLVRSLRSLWHYHHDVWYFHTHSLNTATHVYQSKPEGWLILNRPVGVDAQLSIEPGQQGCTATAGSTCLRQVLLLGTPVLWWFSACAFVWAAVCWVGRRDWRYGLVTVGVLTTWLPWVQYDQRPIFSYYAVLILPFLVLGAVMLLGEMVGPPDASPLRRQVGTVAAGLVVCAVALNFAWFWPVYTDGLLTTQQWLHRIWFRRWI